MIIDLSPNSCIEVGDLVKIDDRYYLIVSDQYCDSCKLFDVVGMFVLDYVYSSVGEILREHEDTKLIAKGDRLKLTLCE